VLSRRFLTDTELDGILDALPDPASIPVGMLDQIDAATSDMEGMSRSMLVGAVARGHSAHLGVLPDDLTQRRALIRPRLKMMLAAFEAGVTHRCEHTQQIGPTLLACDPPSLSCMRPVCLASIDENTKRVGFNWDGQCDGCGQPTEIVFPYLTTLGPLSISGHLCAACKDAMTSQAGGRT
jgi:hypothetical protein